MHIMQISEYKAAVTEVEELNAAYAKIQSRISELHVLLQEPAHRENERKNSVAAALSFLRTGNVEAPKFNREALAEELNVLLSQEQPVKNAIHPAWVRREHLQSHLSVTYCRSGEVAERHKKLARRCIEKLTELDAIFKEEQALIAEVHASGFNPSFPALAFNPQLGMVKGEVPNKTLMDNMLEDLRGYCMSNDERNEHAKKIEQNRKLTESKNRELMARSVNHGVIDLGEA